MGGRRTSPCIFSMAAKARSRSSSKRVSRPFSTSILRYDGDALRPVIRRRIRQQDETDLSRTRKQAARQRALAAEPDRVGGALRARARPAAIRGAVADAPG